MENLVKSIKGYISHQGLRDPQTREGVTISYFESLEAIKTWREHPEHKETQELGRTHFYEHYEVKVVKVEREYEWVIRFSPSSASLITALSNSLTRDW